MIWKKGASAVSGKRGGEALLPFCQVEKCGADLTDSKRYHRRHKVCEVHAKASAIMVSSIRQSFCQQCSNLCRFHKQSEFDEAKRSCRRCLAGHNKRRHWQQIRHNSLWEYCLQMVPDQIKSKLTMLPLFCHQVILCSIWFKLVH